jgi:SpoVK/Ycf46/Vps4 family AAA+-type ATPase
MRTLTELDADDDDAELIRDYLDEAAALRPSDAPSDALPALELLRRRFDLDDFEENVVLLVLAPQIDNRFSEHIARLKRNVVRTQIDIGLALSLFAPSTSDRILQRTKFGPSGRLRAQHLLTLDQRSSREGQLLDVALALPPRIQSMLLGLGEQDPCIEGFSRLIWPSIPIENVVLPQKAVSQVRSLVGQLERYRAKRKEWGRPELDAGGNALILLFAGPPGTGKTMLAHALAHEQSVPLLLVDANQLASSRDLESQLGTILREARLQNAILLFDDCELLFGSRLQGNRDLPMLLAALDNFDGIAILATNLPLSLDPALDRRVTLQLDFELPPPRSRERIWRLMLPPQTPLAEDVDIPILAEKYEFAGAHIRNCVAVSINRALARPGEPLLTQADLEEAARSQVRHRLKQLADRSTNQLTLEDLIVPKDIGERLRAIIAAVRNRRIIFDEWGFGEKLSTGKGLCSLFRGDSGTGKTLAAEIIANELTMPLYRVRIPSIVSKYVGETEKNLEKCFREAGLAGALLLFDEADSIFSKRTEVNNSNDRYSNMETNLLLQEVERFEGIVILTTNLDAAIDDAFERRLNHKIDFPFPDAHARARIWKHLIPAQAPVERPINYNYLGEDFELSGGCIKNAVIRAAYTAAERKLPISMDLLERAAEQEYRELGKLMPMRRNPWD